MREVAIAGVGMTVFGKHAERTLEDLGFEAVRLALGDAGVRPKELQAAYCGNVHGGMLPGQRVLRGFGISHIPITNVENACASAGTALHDAVKAVRVGEFDLVLAFGVEKLSDLGGGLLPQDAHDYDVVQGATLPAMYAMRARRYMYEHGLTLEELARVSVKSHRNAQHNPLVHFRQQWTEADVLGARPIADPLTLYMCCPNSDGAAAAVVCTADIARRRRSSVVRVASSVLVSGRFAPPELIYPEITARAAERAFSEAALGPEDLDVVELHDAFAIAEIMYYEALGLAPRGDGRRLLMDGATEIDGRIPVNPSGGLIARGHPIGATGLAQVAEAFWQLNGWAAGRQTSYPRVALTHVTGGGISGYDNGACAIHVLTI